VRIRKSGEVSRNVPVKENTTHTVAESRVLPNPARPRTLFYTIQTFQLLPFGPSLTSNPFQLRHMPLMPSSMQQDLFRVVRRVSQAPPTLFASPTLPCLYVFHIVSRHYLWSPSPVPTLHSIPFGLLRATAVIKRGVKRRGARKRQGLHCISVRALCRDPHVPCTVMHQGT
jgi:hypothetical protein